MEVWLTDETVYVPLERMREFSMLALMRMGVPLDDARITTEILLVADVWGIRSHGIAHLKLYNDRIKHGHQRATTKIAIVRDMPSTAVVDGGNGMGQVVGYHAMKLAIEKALQCGIGAVAVRNSSHYGIAGYYAKMAVDEGMLGMAFTNARPAVTPTFGAYPLLGTNPIAFGVPTDEPFPFLFDAATSVAARGKVEVLERAHKPTPAGWIIGEDGTTPTDSEQILKDMVSKKAAILPLGGAGELFGGHKGYGLGTMVEILSSTLQGGAYLSGLTDFDANGKPQPLRIGHFFLAMRIENFVTLDEFKANTGILLRELRATRKVPGAERIYTAGEKEYDRTLQVNAQGLDISLGLQKNLKGLAQELGFDFNLGF
ncbi:MAG: Ldh family oxidoreductase [Chloroflexi bacterium]|nr:Ldh family oxidoreductase [Chloroflexota bacterium]